MHQMYFEQALACTAAEAWPHLTRPEQMNAWSAAPIRPLRDGEGQRPDGAGAIREVRIPGLLPMRLTERVTTSSPPRLFCYRVVAGGWMREHAGRIELLDRGERHCLLRWTVDFEPVVPFTAWLAKLIVGRKMRLSLEKLAAIVAA